MGTNYFYHEHVIKGTIVMEKRITAKQITCLIFIGPATIIQFP